MDLFPLRTALFVPGNRPDRIDKALRTSADAVIIDLEDAVPPDQKAEAREHVKAKLAQYPDEKVIVRSNAVDSPQFRNDLLAVATVGLRCVLVPKVETASDVHRINQELLDAESHMGLEPGTMKVLYLIESALAVQNIFVIASEQTEPVRQSLAAFGAADYTTDLGIDITAGGEELMYSRARMCVACRAARMDPPLDSPFMYDLKNPEALRADALRAKQLGFGGKLCIHPNQIEICNEVFSPREEEVAFARKVISAFHEAEEKGQGALLVDGKFVDNPIVERCRRTIRLAELIDTGVP